HADSPGAVAGRSEAKAQAERVDERTELRAHAASRRPRCRLVADVARLDRNCEGFREPIRAADKSRPADAALDAHPSDDRIVEVCAVNATAANVGQSAAKIWIEAGRRSSHRCRISRASPPTAECQPWMRRRTTRARIRSTA